MRGKDFILTSKIREVKFREVNEFSHGCTVNTLTVNLFGALTVSRCCVNSSMLLIQLRPLTLFLLSLFYRWEHWDTERYCKYPRAKQFLSNRARIWSQAGCLRAHTLTCGPHTESSGGLTETNCWAPSGKLGMGPRICISNNLPGDANVTGLGTTLRESML